MTDPLTGGNDHADILDHINESIIVMDLGGFILRWNQGAVRMFGYSKEEAVGRNILFLYADDELDGAGCDTFLETGGSVMEVRRKKKSGEIFWAGLQLSLIRDADGRPTGLLGYLIDITDRIAAQESLRLHARIFEDSEEGIAITDVDRRILTANQAFCRMMGYRMEELCGMTATALLLSQRNPLEMYQALEDRLAATGNWRGELWCRRRDGSEFPGWQSISVVKNADGETSHFFAIVTDITERKRSEEQINRLAFFDALTELPNRTLLFRLSDQALIEAKRNHSHGALLFIDLNRFKPINDTLGHAVGDRVLRDVAFRLRKCLRNEDVVARLGGDEFVIALFDLSRREHASIVAQKVLASLAEPLVVENHELKLGAAIGISIYPDDGDDIETLIRLADIAMYRAKQAGDGYTFYSQEMNERDMHRLKIEVGLRHALERGELLLYYQPKVDLATGRIVGVEALVRWKHPERGLVPPIDFIPIAEETGLIVQIGSWVLDAACAQASAWHRAGLPPIKVAVNVSAKEFAPALSQRVMEVLQRHQVEPSWLELEITEGMLTHSTEAVIHMMEELTSLGISLSLDDFGTGFSSLSYLKRFPIDTLKIDRSFITGIPDDLNDCAIASAIVSISKQLKHRVIAEGVETAQHLSFLRDLGCDEIQGYLFSPPVPPQVLANMLSEDKRLVCP